MKGAATPLASPRSRGKVAIGRRLTRVWRDAFGTCDARISQIARPRRWPAWRGAVSARSGERPRRMGKMENFKIDVDGDGIALITFDVPGRSMNTITGERDPRSLSRSSTRSRPTTRSRASVITSGKASGFCAGADLGEMNERGARRREARRSREEEKLKAQFERGFGSNKVLSRPRNLRQAGRRSRSKAWRSAAASNSRSPATTASPPTIRRSSSACRKSKVGLLPGAGGTQRLPRLIGVQNAAMMILQGADKIAAGGQGPRLHQRSRCARQNRRSARRNG